MTISIANVVNVNVLATPAGLELANINSLALFTTEKPSNIDPYRIYIEPSGVEADYGTSSKTLEMANIIFSGSPSVIAGGGRLVIIPFTNAISAISGIWTSADIAANFNNIKAVANGDLRVSLDGDNIDLTGLDFTNAQSLADVSAILQSKLVDVIVTSKVTGFDLTSKSVGSASAITLAQLPAGSGTDLSVASLLNTAGGTPTVGNNAQGETLVEAIARIGDTVQYVPLITNLEMESAVIEAAATSIQAGRKIFLHHFVKTTELEITTGTCSIIKDKKQSRTRCLFYNVSPSQANLFKSAYASRLFTTIFSGSNTTITMNLKDLVGIVGDPAIDQTILDKAKVAGADSYGIYAEGNIPKVQSHGANRYADEVYNEESLILNIEVASFNYLAPVLTKVPQTEEGMEGYKSAIEAVLIQFVRNQYIAPGTWTSPIVFGDPELLKENIAQNGYYIYGNPIALQPQADREIRKAPLLQIAYKQAGAIHSSIINLFQQR